jgi:hypothetical protein
MPNRSEDHCFLCLGAHRVSAAAAVAYKLLEPSGRTLDLVGKIRAIRAAFPLENR